MAFPGPQSPAQPPLAVRGGALDALRFVAAMFVVVFHFGDAAPIALQSMHGFLARGYLATDFFLILSGFVLAKAYGASVASGRLPFGRFWSKRFARCYPTHIITLGLLVLMVAVAAALGLQPSDPHRFEWSGLPAQILLLHAFGQGGGQWNIPSWTISTLLICYAAFPTLWRAMLKLTSAASALSAGLMVLVVSDLAALTLIGTQQFDLPFQWSLMRAAPLFLIGLCLARAVQTARWSPAEARTLGFGGGAVLLLNAAIVGPDLISVLAICAIVMGCGASPPTRSLPLAAWGARVSFSLFMVHTLTGAVWFDLVRPLIARLDPSVMTAAWQGWTVWLGALAFTLAGAAVYDRVVDAPIQRALSRRFFAPEAPGLGWGRSRTQAVPRPTGPIAPRRNPGR